MLDGNLLRGPKLKVRRATERIDTLGDVHAKLFANTTPSLVEEEDPSSGDRLLKLKLDVDIPEDLCLTVGEAVYHLRSALDQLAVTLAQAKGVLASRDVYFPIAKDIGSFEKTDGRAQKFLNGVESDAAKEIRALRPYKGGTDKLWGLHALAQVDKHNSLIALGVANGRALFDHINVRNAKIGMIVGDLRGRLDKGILISNLGRDGVFDCSEGNIEVKGYLAFGDDIEVFGNAPVVRTLQEMAHFVDQVIDRF